MSALADGWWLDGAGLVDVGVQQALGGVGALGIGAGVVGIVGAGFAQIIACIRAMQGHAGMTVCLQRCPTVGTFNRLGINGLMAARAVRHLFDDESDKCIQVMILVAWA